jgi:uncharacterized membrane protein
MHSSTPTTQHVTGRSLSELEDWSVFSGGMLLLLAGASRRSLPGWCVAVAGAPLLYRGLTGRWPELLRLAERSETRRALGGRRGIQVREAIRLELPIEEVYGYWRRLENLPAFMYHLTSVEVLDGKRSRWIARGPAGLTVSWDADIINEVPNQVIGWRSVEGADVVTAGSVNFDAVRGDRGTQLTVHLQYHPPAGKAGAWFASLFGSEPSQTIREDLRRFKQILESGELAQAVANGAAR